MALQRKFPTHLTITMEGGEEVELAVHKPGLQELVAISTKLEAAKMWIEFGITVIDDVRAGDLLTEGGHPLDSSLGINWKDHLLLEFPDICKEVGYFYWFMMRPKKIEVTEPGEKEKDPADFSDTSEQSSTGS